MTEIKETETTMEDGSISVLVEATALTGERLAIGYNVTAEDMALPAADRAFVINFKRGFAHDAVNCKLEELSTPAFVVDRLPDETTEAFLARATGLMELRTVRDAEDDQQRFEHDDAKNAE